MPGAAVPQLLSYGTIVDVDMDATNDVNLADAEDYGHRVVVEVSAEAIKGYLAWYRAIGGDRPLAKLNTTGEAVFKAALEEALADTYVDIDGVTGGLHFSSAVLSTNPDARIRKDGLVSANDLPLAYVLYKLYGSSTAPTLDKIYNLEDAHQMLENASVADAIIASLKANENGTVDKMFRDLLAADPHRFFDASGVPMVGIFETKTDLYGSGNWKTVANDTFEIKTKFIFKSKVSRRGVAGAEVNVSTPENAAGTQNNQQTVINPNDYFYVRLQLKAKAGPAPPAPPPPPPSGTVVISSFTNPSNNGATEFSMLASAAYPLTIGNGTVYSYGPEYNTSAYSVTYNASIDEIWMLDTGFPTVKFHKVGSSYVAYFDQYGRSDVVGQMKFN
jgi:hypothetical protein